MGKINSGRVILGGLFAPETRKNFASGKQVAVLTEIFGMQKQFIPQLTTLKLTLCVPGL